MNDRIQTLVKALPPQVDGALIVGDINRRYYTGMRSSAGTLLVTKKGAYFIIDFRYIEAARATVSGAEVLLQKNLGEQLRELLTRDGVNTLGVESRYLTLSEYMAFEKMLPGVKLAFDEEVSNLILAQRRTKEKAELASLQKAQDIADASFRELLPFIKAGVTERQVRNRLEDLMREKGSERVSFSTIAVAGPNSSKPHGTPSDYVLKEGDFLTLDFGATVDGYGSDMTRTVGIGSVSPEMEEVYRTVLEAQLAALAAIKAGVPCNEIDRAARDIITAAGYGDSFGHGLGHSIGLEVHEDPRFNTVCTDLTTPGIVMSVEPGIYLDGRFGVRIEDMIVVTEDGLLNMTHSPKELILCK